MTRIALILTLVILNFLSCFIEDVYLLLHSAPVDAVLETRNRWLSLMLAGFDAERREWPDASDHPDR